MSQQNLGSFSCPHPDGPFLLTVFDLAGWSTGSCLIRQIGQSQTHDIVLAREEAGKLAKILADFAGTEVQSSALDRAKAALTPSAETKAAYSGEITFESEVYVSVQESYMETVTVPWTTIKEIMKMIRKQAGME